MDGNTNTWIEEWASYNSDLIKSAWGRDGKPLLALIGKYAGVEEQQATTHHFEAFWAAYPAGKRKVNKQGCMLIWKRLRLDDLVDDILTALEAAKRDEDWTKQQGAFIPMPSVWLGQRRWEAYETAPVNSIFAQIRNK